MSTLLAFFFFVTFLFGFSRTLLEIFIKPRDEVLLKFSSILMGLSVLFFGLIYWTGVARRSPVSVLSFDLMMGFSFLAGAFCLGWFAYVWLSRLK